MSLVSILLSVLLGTVTRVLLDHNITLWLDVLSHASRTRWYLLGLLLSLTVERVRGEIWSSVA